MESMSFFKYFFGGWGGGDLLVVLNAKLIIFHKVAKHNKPCLPEHGYKPK